jgi:hypothetical protein
MLFLKDFFDGAGWRFMFIVTRLADGLRQLGARCSWQAMRLLRRRKAQVLLVPRVAGSQQ